jgi:invasion protein IalB
MTAMRRSVFRVPVIGLGFFLMAGVIHPVAGRTATTPSTAATASAPSPVTVSQAFSGWAFRCIYAAHDIANGPALCLAEQDLSAQDHGKTVPLGAVLIGKSQGLKGVTLADAPFRLTLMTPLGFLLTHPVTLAADGSAPVSFTYQTCTTQGCLSSGDVPPALLASLRHGKTGHLQITKLSGGTVTINFALTGLAGALAAIDAVAASKAPA